jgi:cardiolipin synthase
MTTFDLLAVMAMVVVVVLFALVLFEPGLPYEVRAELPEPGAPEFCGLLASLVDTPLRGDSKVTLLSGGAAFYEAELEAIAGARYSVHLEAYVFHSSAIARRFVEVLAERARNGVRVRLVIDAWGSMLTRDGYFSELRKAGGEVRWYQPLRWYTLKRFNNRTHRELIVVDDGTDPVGDLIERIAGALPTTGTTVEPWLSVAPRRGLLRRGTARRIEAG